MFLIDKLYNIGEVVFEFIDFEVRKFDDGTPIYYFSHKNNVLKFDHE